MAAIGCEGIVSELHEDLYLLTYCITLSNSLVYLQSEALQICPWQITSKSCTSRSTCGTLWYGLGSEVTDRPIFSAHQSEQYVYAYAYAYALCAQVSSKGLMGAARPKVTYIVELNELSKFDSNSVSSLPSVPRLIHTHSPLHHHIILIIAIMATETVDFKLYRYNPSIVAAILFTILFLSTTTLHLYQMLRTRTWILIPFVLGGICKPPPNNPTPSSSKAPPLT